jgi:hypothetical protein
LEIDQFSHAGPGKDAVAAFPADLAKAEGDQEPDEVGKANVGNVAVEDSPQQPLRFHAQTLLTPYDTQTASNQERTTVPNFDFVTERLATGGDLHWREDLALADLAALVDAGITRVIDCPMERRDEELVARHALAGGRRALSPDPAGPGDFCCPFESLSSHLSK